MQPGGGDDPRPSTAGARRRRGWRRPRSTRWVPGDADGQELEAYAQEYEHRSDTGISEAQLVDLKGRMQYRFERLPAGRKPAWAKRYGWLPMCVAFIYQRRGTNTFLYCTTAARPRPTTSG